MDAPDSQAPASSGHDAPVDGASPPIRQRFPSWKQALVTAGGGFVLALTACFGFLVSLGGNFDRGGHAVLTPLAAVLFGVGVITVLVGLILVVVRLFRGLTSNASSSGR